MNVLVIAEDPTHDAHIIKPVVEALLEDAGLKARVSVLQDPHLRGASQALDPQLVAEVVADNRAMVELFLLVVDLDCDRDGHRARALERQAEHENVLVACLAVHEVEVWMLALYSAEVGAPFSEVRAHCDPKEAYAESLLSKLGRTGPGGGRKAAMRALKGQWRGLRERCTELRDLQKQIVAFCARRA